jgi:putative phosphoesterase
VKILVVSDTHEDTFELERILSRHASEVKVVCHLGDHAMDLLKFQSLYPQLTMVAVGGNCDYSNVERERVLEFTPCADSGSEAAARILLTHGHNHGVKTGLDRLAYYAKEKGANAAFYGHTHFPACLKHGGIFIMNPGSPSFPRGGSKASYGIAEISPEGGISGRLFSV